MPNDAVSTEVANVAKNKPEECSLPVPIAEQFPAGSKFIIAKRICT